MTKHQNLGAYRAVKVVDKCSAQAGDTMREAYMLRDLRCNHVPQIYDIHEDKAYFYIVEEYVEGVTLTEYVTSQRHKISERKIVDIIMQVIEVIDYLHRLLSEPVLYLDLKPDNIMITPREQVILIDFGCAMTKREAKKRDISYGTPGYAAPEQYGLDTLDEGTDIYSIGAVMYYMMHSRALNTDMRLSATDISDNNYSMDISNIVLKCILPDRRDRIASTQELCSELARFIEHKKVIAGKSLVIAVSGIDRRSGRTHFSLAAVSYLNSMGIDAIYQEEDIWNISESLKKYADNVYEEGGVFYVCGCPILPRYGHAIKNNLSNYEVIVCDCDTPNNQVFEEADVRIIITGAKEWERNKIEETDVMAEGMVILYNLCSVKQYKNAVKSVNISNITCMRMPYFPDPFVRDANVNFFLESLLRPYCECRDNRRGKGITCFLKKIIALKR